MAKLTLTNIFLAGVTMVSGAALAGSPAGPAYVGGRSANPEQETYGAVTKPEAARPLAFMGPARHFGPITGEPERDTLAYRALFGVEADGLWSFTLARQ